ncbi:hypothetical protein Tco_0569588 [Tanacetum coccineum]
MTDAKEMWNGHQSRFGGNDESQKEQEEHLEATVLKIHYDSQYTYGPEKTQPSESESQTTELDTCNSNISTEPSELVSEPVVNESNVEVQR